MNGEAPPSTPLPPGFLKPADDADLVLPGAEVVPDRFKPTGHANDGLASDGWWRVEPLRLANAARQWVRWRLLALPQLSDSDADRFIASLSPAKREDLFRRAVDGRGTEGF